MDNKIAEVLQQLLNHTDKETKLEIAYVVFKDLCINPEDYLKPTPIRE